MGSRLRGKIRRLIREHALPLIYVGRECRECKYFNPDNNYCYKWQRKAYASDSACRSFSPIPKRPKRCIFKVTLIGEYKPVKKASLEVKNLANKNGLKSSLYISRIKTLKLRTYKACIQVYNPTQTFIRKLNRLISYIQEREGIRRVEGRYCNK